MDSFEQLRLFGQCVQNEVFSHLEHCRATSGNMVIQVGGGFVPPFDPVSLRVVQRDDTFLIVRSARVSDLEWALSTG